VTADEFVKIVVPDAGPINTLGAAGLLDYLLLPENAQLVLVDEVRREIVSRSSELADFVARNAARILTYESDIGRAAAHMRAMGLKPLRNSGEQAVIEFILHGVDEAIGNAPALIVYEDKRLPRAQLRSEFGERAHMITTAAYLRKLEAEGLIASFAETWAHIVSANSSSARGIHREPGSEEREIPTPKGSRIRFKR
jgi:hypothetical protein